MVISIPDLLVVLLLFSESYIITTSTLCDVESRFVATSGDYNIIISTV